ncbi:MAG TPA: FRG domain-containing protein [Bryobacteraceae bacterium]|nr:FRG domain-containing protein [Bryobacteraceae bacterium]
MPSDVLEKVPNPITSWEELARAQDLFRKAEDQDEWVFRGTHDGRPDLRTTLELVAKEFGVAEDKIPDMEVKLIHEFVRRYHLYSLGPPPRRGDTLEWLTLMRHYGAPCRFLDFTFSFIIAAFFSLEREGSTQPVVWAINKSWLTRKVAEAIGTLGEPVGRQFDLYRVHRDGHAFRKLFLEAPLPPLVSAVGSYRMNERLTIQQGLFLCPTDVRTPFMVNLHSMPDHERNIGEIKIAAKTRPDLLAGLHRANLNRATLFPGLDGFAASLWTRVASLKRLKSMEDADTEARSKINLDIRALARW